MFLSSGVGWKGGPQGTSYTLDVHVDVARAPLVVFSLEERISLTTQELILGI